MTLLAEQILIDCPPARLEALLGHPPSWMTPLLRLAGDEGEAAGLAVLGEGAAADRRRPTRGRAHHAELRRIGAAGGNHRVALRWQAAGYRVLFSELDGTIQVRPMADRTVLSIEGAYAPPRGRGSTTRPVARRRAAEKAARSLLGHLRSAVEQERSGVEVVHLHQ
jgi:hypothetical protein